MRDVVAYACGSESYAWCGWCRQWRSYGRLTADVLVVRPSGCSKERNPDCPDRDNALVTVWPVLVVRPVVRKGGDGWSGGPLPISGISTGKRSEPVGSHAGVMLPVGKRRVSLCRFGAKNGWRVRMQNAIGPWDVLSSTGKVIRTRVIESCVIRFDRDADAVVVAYHEDRFAFALAHGRGRLGANELRPLLKEKN